MDRKLNRTKRRQDDGEQNAAALAAAHGPQSVLIERRPVCFKDPSPAANNLCSYVGGCPRPADWRSDDRTGQNVDASSLANDWNVGKLFMLARCTIRKTAQILQCLRLPSIRRFIPATAAGDDSGMLFLALARQSTVSHSAVHQRLSGPDRPAYHVASQGRARPHDAHPRFSAQSRPALAKMRSWASADSGQAGELLWLPAGQCRGLHWQPPSSQPHFSHPENRQPAARLTADHSGYVRAVYGEGHQGGHARSGGGAAARWVSAKPVPLSTTG